MDEIIVLERDLLIISVILGAYLGILYDIFEGMRLATKHKNWIIWIEDFVFWILAAFTTFCTLYKFNYGIIRGYFFLGVGIGVAIYKITFSKMVVWILSYVWAVVFVLFVLIYRIILKPIGRIIKTIINRLKKIPKQVKIAINRINN